MNKSDIKRRIKKEYGSNPLENSYKDESKNMLRLVRIYHDLKEEKDAQVIDDITWEDIEMDEVFFRVNHTRSYMGEQILYHMLHLIKKDKTQRFELHKGESLGIMTEHLSGVTVNGISSSEVEL